MVEIAFNHATVRERADMLEFLDLCAERGVQYVSIWGQEIDKVGEDVALRRMRELGLRTLGYHRIGPFTDKGLSEAQRELERAARFGADHVYLFTGGGLEQSHIAGERARVEQAAADLLPAARALGLKLAIEPLHPMLAGDRSVFSTLAQANAICDRLGAGTGVVIDAHHVWWDPELDQEISRAGAADRILGFHVNDWQIPTRDLVRDRGMIGDGVIDLASMAHAVRDAGFQGPVEVEIFSDKWWNEDPGVVMDIAMSRCHDVFDAI